MRHRVFLSFSINDGEVRRLAPCSRRGRNGHDGHRAAIDGSTASNDVGRRELLTREDADELGEIDRRSTTEADHYFRLMLLEKLNATLRVGEFWILFKFGESHHVARMKHACDAIFRTGCCVGDRIPDQQNPCR